MKLVSTFGWRILIVIGMAIMGLSLSIGLLPLGLHLAVTVLPMPISWLIAFIYIRYLESREPVLWQSLEK